MKQKEQTEDKNDIDDKAHLGKEIIELLYKNKMILTWYKNDKNGYRLASGLWSPFYINLRNLSAFPLILQKIAKALGNIIKEKINNKKTSLIGLPMAGIPIATATSLYSKIPGGFIRKIDNAIIDIATIAKYGKHSLIEGRFLDNDNIVLVDDLVSFFTSKEMYIDAVHYEAKQRNITVMLGHILVLIDREQGAKALAEKRGLNLISLIPFKSRGIKWLKNVLSCTEYEVIGEYLDDTKARYQDKKLQEQIIKRSPLQH